MEELIKVDGGMSRSRVTFDLVAWEVTLDHLEYTHRTTGISQVGAGIVLAGEVMYLSSWSYEGRGCLTPWDLPEWAQWGMCLRSGDAGFICRDA